MKKQDFIHGSAVLAVSAVITKIIGALFRIPLASLLGGEGMGYFSCAYGIFMPVFAVTATGLPSAAARIVSRDIGLRGGASLGKIKRTALAVFGGAGIAGSLLVAFGAYPFCRFAVDNMPALPAVIMIAPSVAAGCMSAVLRGFCEGMHNMYPTALSQAAEALAKLIFGLAGVYAVLEASETDPALLLGLVHYRGVPDAAKMREITLSIAAAAGCAGVSLSSFAGLLYMAVYDMIHRKEYDTAVSRKNAAPADTRTVIGELMEIALPAALCALVTNVTSMIDLATVMNSVKTAAERSPEAFASYGLTPAGTANFLYGSFSGLAITVFNLVPSVTNMFGRSMMPEAAAAHASGDRKALGKCALDIIYITAFAAVPCGFGIAALAKPILSLLFPGSPAEVGAAWRPLAVMGAGMIMLCISSAIFTVFQAAGRADIPVKLMALGAAVKAAGNLLLVPVPALNITGAAISTDISYLVILTGSLIMLGKTAGPGMRELLGGLTVFLLCGALCGASAAAAVSFLNLYVKSSAATVCAVFCGGMFYIISTYLSGIIGKTTLKMLISEKKFKKT